MMSTFKNNYMLIGKLSVIVLAVVGLLFLPRMAFKNTMTWVTNEALTEEEERSNGFEEHLYNAKLLVAKELNYEGPIERLSLYTNSGYYSYKLLTENGEESGSFDDATAKAELNMAVSYRNNHADALDVVGAGVSGLESGFILGMFFAVVLAVLIIFAARGLLELLDDPEEFMDRIKKAKERVT